MTWKTHTAQAAITAAVASHYLLPIEVAALFLSIILIDVDHYFDFVVVCRRYSIKDMFKFHRFVWEHKHGIYGINALHTLEVFAALFFLGYVSRLFIIVLAGFLMHMALDLISFYYHDILFNRAFSIIEYLIKKRNPASNGYPVPDETFWNEP